ncbi:four helix bundle protein, partial [Patescibacteria group bacterium]|nr:four helix bundle protein [Patescibacteria group bacterium]
MPKPKSLKTLIQNFDSNKPDFANLIPYLTGESEANLEKLEGSLIGKWGAIQTLYQLEKLNDPEHVRKTKSRSRVWKSTNAYIFLVAWSNASLLRILATKWFEWFKTEQTRGFYRNLEELKQSDKSPIKSSNFPLRSSRGFKFIDRLEAQLLDCLRSTVANIEEGFARPTTSEYLTFLGYSQASLK